MTDYERLVELIEKTSTIDCKGPQATFSFEFRKWYKDCVNLINKCFGSNSLESKMFSEIEFDNGIIAGTGNMSSSLASGLSRAYWFLSSLSEELKNSNLSMSKDIFIVHGHDGELKEKVARLLTKLDFNPIILHEQNNLGKTIIEKVEYYGNNAGAAIVLFTPDDVGKVKSGKKTIPRARQNVVFEAGYFMGLFGRERTITVVSDKSIELPGDLSGVIYVESSNCIEIADALKAMGYDIDKNKL